MNVEECRKVLAEREAVIRRQRLPVTALRFDSDSLVAADIPLRLTGNGVAQLCKTIGAPFPYIGSLDKTVRTQLLVYHLGHGDFGTGYTSVTSRGDEFIGLGAPDLLVLPGTDVLEASLDAGQDAVSLTVHNLDFHGQSFQLDLLSCNDSLSEEVGPGDVVQAGLRITHSLIGEHATWVESFLLRLVCANGMTHRDCVSRSGPRTRRLPIHLPRALELQRDQIRRLAADAWGALRRKLDSLRALQGERVEVEPFLEGFLPRARLSTARLMPLLRGAWEREGRTATAYSAVNALTWVATHAPELGLRQRRVLGGLAGLLAFRRIHLCPRCFSLLTGPAAAAGNTSDDNRVMHI